MATRVLCAVIAGFVVAACNPFGGGEFRCTTDPQCGAGKCSDGLCSFADATCMSGYRYGELAGSRSNTCVGNTDGGMDDEPFMDAHVPMDGVYCYGAGFGTACFEAPPVNTLVLTPQALSTDTSTLCATNVMGHPPWCVIAAADITIAAGTFSATGTRPLVLVATGTITVTGTLDVASRRGGQIGAGSITGTALCDPGTGPGNNGGGAGGSFGAAGGNGGNGGATAGAIKPATMRGGCPGQDGKSGTFGVKGAGGGAVYLIAGTQITIAGTINASGAAGSGGVSGNGGGGGGGSGGLIALDAPAISMTNAFVFANGGGGAEGSGNNMKGNDGNESINGAAAPATASASNGGDGGAGGATTPAGNGGNTPGFGGGGGGGGAGAIRRFQATSITGTGVVSPAPT